jgi:streptogramin lyase
MKSIPWAAYLAGTVLLPAVVYSATIAGEVKSEGNPVRGALVTLFSADRLVSETVLTDATGHYRLGTQLHGALSIRARAPLDADDVGKLEVPAGDAKLTHEFSLRPLTRPQEISDSLPASAHFARIKLPTLTARWQFQADCVGCHEVGNPLTRRPRSLDEWTTFMRIMLSNAEYTNDAHVADYTAAMSHAFDGTPTPAHERTTVDEAALNSRITEWKLPGALVCHDADFYPPDGTFYTVELYIDQVYVTDPRLNKTTVLPIPALGSPIGGTFAGKQGTAAWLPPVSHGVHSLQLGPDGMFYMAASIGGEILVLDPAHRTYTAHKVGGAASYPHTLRFDSKGIVWFTVYESNQVGRFDPKTGKSTLIDLPNTMAGTDKPSPAAYGIDISPLDGSVWYTQMWANRVGRIDPITFQVQEWKPPVFTPRRLRFDRAGGLWIPGFSDGTLTRLDTRTMKYDTYKIPTLADDEVEAPYAVAVDPKTQDVWVTANVSDRMFRFVPKTKSWTAYPLPTRGVYMRDLVFTPYGVCGSSNPFGVPLEGVVEDNMDSLICVQPEGNQ